MIEIETFSSEETYELGRRLGTVLKAGAIICLNGDLGVGKTVFTTGLAKGLGCTDDVSSPTFTLIQEYHGGRLALYHFDVYRIADISEMDEIGFDEYAFGDGVCVIEWGSMIKEILPETSYEKPANTVHIDSLHDLLQHGLMKRHHMEMKVKRISETEAKLTFRIVPYENEKYRCKLFVTIPPLHFCGLIEKITVTAKKISILDLCGEEDTVLFDLIVGNKFYFYGREVAEISADLIYKKPVRKGKNYRFVSVSFYPGGKRYDYLCELALAPGDQAVVMTSHGETVVTVEAIFEKTESELALPLTQYKRILRKAE